MIFVRSYFLIWFTFLLTTVTVVLNIYVQAKVNSILGIQLLNLVAIAFGGYMAIYQWRILTLLQQSRRQ